MNKLFTLILLVFFTIDSSGQNDNSDNGLKIAFGSCANQVLPNNIWPSIVNENADVWIWTGDIIYMDSDNLDFTKKAYDIQKSNPDYVRLLKTSEIIGIWDDHDYGLNDGGKEWEVKDAKKELMLEFLDEPDNSPRHNHKGVYTSYDYKVDNAVTVKVILLDGRYFRDTLSYSPIRGRRYEPNPYGQGTILGEVQWAWLEEELNNSDAQLNIIVSGIQVLSEEHGFESWGGNFLHERDKLFELLKSSNAQNVMFISGDRHIAENSKTEIEGLNYPIYDVTSSGLTHSYEGADEPNKYRVSQLIDQKNYGVLNIKSIDNKLSVDVSIKGESDTLYYQETILYNIDE